MKGYARSLLFIVVLILCVNFARAQYRIGYVDFKVIVNSMPETKAAFQQAEKFRTEVADELTAMRTQYNDKLALYNAMPAVASDTTRRAAEITLRNLEVRMQEVVKVGEQELNDKLKELSKPIIEKARWAIRTIADERHYLYVLDVDQLYMKKVPSRDNLMPAVKAKLGIK